jgi:predicted RNase H-like nuclease (RuvC/YqgF family)
VACFDYAKGFGEKLVEVLVNPADVVCVPVDYNGTKMRVCRFEVVAECQEMNTELVKKLAKDESNYSDAHEGIGDNFDNDEEEEMTALEEELMELEEELENKREEVEQMENELEEVEENYRHAKRGKNGQFVKKGRK